MRSVGFGCPGAMGICCLAGAMGIPSCGACATVSSATIGLGAMVSGGAQSSQSYGNDAAGILHAVERASFQGLHRPFVVTEQGGELLNLIPGCFQRLFQDVPLDTLAAGRRRQRTFVVVVGLVPGDNPSRENVVVVQYAGEKAGIVVDQLLGEFQTVIKPLGRLFRHMQGIGGSTILGSGEVALILDVQALVSRSARSEEHASHGATGTHRLEAH